jgi:hypothetical protein
MISCFVDFVAVFRKNATPTQARYSQKISNPPTSEGISKSPFLDCGISQIGIEGFAV